MPRQIACYAMSDRSHFEAMLPVVAELAGAGARIRFWTAAAFRAEVEAVGAEFADLFDPVSTDALDDTSRPLPARFVTFAGVRAEALAALARAWGADLVVGDGFALVARLVAQRLGVPWVTVVSGHVFVGPALRAALLADARVRTDPRCLAAVERLKTEYGLADASPASYVPDPSPWLNIALEPREWLSAEEADRLGNVACFGALPSSALAAARERPVRNTDIRVYAAFGTIIWRYWPELAANALAAIAAAVARRPGATLTIGLGGATLPPETLRGLAGPGVTIEPMADQWAELGRADLFVTHQGVVSTHEGVIRGVPMLSFPFFVDQIPLARRCAEFGVAMPLGDGPALTPLVAAQVAERLERCIAQQALMLERLALARRWEEQVIADRAAVANRILAL